MGLEFALVARIKTFAAPFGPDALLQFHRQIGYVGLVFVLTHVALSAKWHVHKGDQGAGAGLVRHGRRDRAVALIGSSIWRQRLRLKYEWWHAAHSALAIFVIAAALGHVFFVHEYVSILWKQVLWTLMSVAFVVLVLWVRVLKPRRLRGQPWRLESVGSERGQTTTLVLRPPDGLDFAFMPGQFAWFVFGRSPFSITQHPFSFSSSSERDGLEIAVKALGDFSSQVHELEPGIDVFVDGPHGVFSIDEDEGPGFGFIAGGVGVTGLLSMLRTMADREDARPAVLFYANGDWDAVAFRDQLAQLEQRMANLTVVHVLQRPPDGWEGETGYVTGELLARHLPPGYRRFQFFICGPGPMMDAAEAALIDIDVPAERVHTERFDMV